jgi:hypothetical protein
MVLRRSATRRDGGGSSHERRRGRYLLVLRQAGRGGHGHGGQGASLGVLGALPSSRPHDSLRGRGPQPLACYLRLPRTAAVRPDAPLWMDITRRAQFGTGAGCSATRLRRREVMAGPCTPDADPHHPHGRKPGYIPIDCPNRSSGRSAKRLRTSSCAIRSTAQSGF